MSLYCGTCGQYYETTAHICQSTFQRDYSLDMLAKAQSLLNMLGYFWDYNKALWIKQQAALDAGKE